MPGPGPHMMYAFGSGLGLMKASNGRFSPHHCLCYAIILGFPLSLLYSWASKVALSKGMLDSLCGSYLSRTQCFLLIAAGSLSHFLLDHLFEENGHSSTYIWILSTGWWINRAPINPDAVVVVGLLCTCLIIGFIYINRPRPSKSINMQINQSVKLIMIIASLYCLWCASQIYLVKPSRPAVGEEADLGVLVFLCVYFALPHYLCIKSMNPKEYHELGDQLPL